MGGVLTNLESRVYYLENTLRNKHSADTEGTQITLAEWNYGKWNQKPDSAVLSGNRLEMIAPEHGLYSFTIRTSEKFDTTTDLMRFQVNGYDVCSIRGAFASNNSAYICNKNDTIRIESFTDQANTYALVRYTKLSTLL